MPVCPWAKTEKYQLFLKTKKVFFKGPGPVEPIQHQVQKELIQRINLRSHFTAFAEALYWRSSALVAVMWKSGHQFWFTGCEGETEGDEWYRFFLKSYLRKF